MAASYQNPAYTVVITSGNYKYNVTKIITDLTLSEQENGISQCATFKMANVSIDGKTASSRFNVMDNVVISANTGDKKGEVFRGYIWVDKNNASTDKELEFKCYDNLIYFMQSEDYKFFQEGSSTKTICKSICKSWGVSLSYTYKSIKHGKLALRGTLADIFTSDILEEVRKKTGVKYVMRSIKGKVHIDPVGQNKIIYNLKKKENVLQATAEISMESVVTKVVVITSKKNENFQTEATVKGKIKKYGTLQKIINKASDTSLNEAKKEAQQEIKDNGKPKKRYAIKAIDNPWIRKGDKVHVEAGGLNGDYIVLSITHDITNKKTMTLEVEAA